MAQDDINLKEGKFSIHGYLYYRKRKKRFAMTSISRLLLTRDEKGSTKSITRAIKMVRDKEVYATRNGKQIKLKPVTQLRKNDIVTIDTRYGEIYWKFNGEKLIYLK